MSDQNETTIPELREAAERGREARQEAEQLRRENAFLKAGIDPESPRAKYFVKGYDGELSAEAIKSEAQAAGIFEIPKVEAEPEEAESERRQPTPDERALDDLSSNVAADAAPPSEPPKADVKNEMWDAYSERRKSAPIEEASAEVIGRIMGAALIDKDERFLA